MTVTFTTREGEDKSGISSGFIVKAPGDGDYVVTARHVVDPALAVPKYVNADLKIIGMGGWQYSPKASEQKEQLSLFRGNFIHSSDPKVDLAIIPLDWGVGPIEQGPLNQWIPLELLADESEYETDIRVGDFLASPGFTELPGVELDHPVLLTGLIASDPRFPKEVTRRGGSVSRAVLYQSLSRSGLSGAPIFATQRGISFGAGITGPAPRPFRFVGVNTGSFHDTQETPLQFSYFTPSTELIKLLTDPSTRVDWRASREA